MTKYKGVTLARNSKAYELYTRMSSATGDDKALYTRMLDAHMKKLESMSKALEGGHMDKYRDLYLQ